MSELEEAAEEHLRRMKAGWERYGSVFVGVHPDTRRGLRYLRPEESAADFLDSWAGLHPVTRRSLYYCDVESHVPARA